MTPRVMHPGKRRITVHAPADEAARTCRFRGINKATGEIVDGPWRAVLDWLSWQIAVDDIDTSDVSMVRISGGPE